MFELGDKVRILKGCGCAYITERCIGKKGTIIKVTSYDYLVRKDGIIGECEECYYFADELELLRENGEFHY